VTHMHAQLHVQKLLYKDDTGAEPYYAALDSNPAKENHTPSPPPALPGTLSVVSLPPPPPPLTPLSLFQPLSHARVLSLSLALAYSLSLSLSHGHMHMHEYEAGERGFVANRQRD